MRNASRTLRFTSRGEESGAIDSLVKGAPAHHGTKGEHLGKIELFGEEAALSRVTPLTSSRRYASRLRTSRVSSRASRRAGVALLARRSLAIDRQLVVVLGQDVPGKIIAVVQTGNP